MRATMKPAPAHGEQLLTVIEHLKGKSNPVAVIVMGFDSEESDKLLGDIAHTENMLIADYEEIKEEYNSSAEEANKIWRQQINEAMMNRRSVIIKKGFGSVAKTRKEMVTAARTGMKHVKTILLKLSFDSVKGLSYFETKRSMRIPSGEWNYISQDLNYAGFALDEKYDVFLELVV